MDGIKAILLDVDGTVLDTREFIYQAAEYALNTEGYPPVPREQIARAVGHSFDDFYSIVLEKPDLEASALQAAHRIFQLEHMDLSVPFPNAEETLIELKRRGYRLAAVTSRWRASVMATLDAARLTNLFDVVMAAGDSPELKPSPMPLLMALARMGCVASEAVMVGDTDIDVEAGNAANMKTVRVRYGFMMSDGEKVKADFYIEKNISELLDLFP